jgi:hypothetical protein
MKTWKATIGRKGGRNKQCYFFGVLAALLTNTACYAADPVQFTPTNLELGSIMTTRPGQKVFNQEVPLGKFADCVLHVPMPDQDRYKDTTRKMFWLHLDQTDALYFKMPSGETWGFGYVIKNNQAVMNEFVVSDADNKTEEDHTDVDEVYSNLLILLQNCHLVKIY